MQDTHITSMVLHVNPNDIKSIINELLIYPNLDISTYDTARGKIVVVLESPSFDGVKNTIEKFESLSGVFLVAMVYHHTETEASLDEGLI